MHFFRNDKFKSVEEPNPRVAFRSDLEDDMVRCKQCGKTIAEHTAPTTPDRDFEERATKKSRTEPDLCRLLEQGKYCEFAEALCAFAQRHSEKDPEDFCAPRRLPRTWESGAWRDALSVALGRCDFTDGADVRAPRVLGLVAASGDGKTHALLEAAIVLNARLIYITYNSEQDLALDKGHPRIAILLRVILSVHGFGNLTCGSLFAACSDKFASLPVKNLLQCAVSAVKREQRSFVVAVDECRLIGNTNARQVASVLGSLAATVHTDGIRCCVLLSSLAKDAWVTTSERRIESVRLPRPKDDDVAQFVLDQFIASPTPQQLSMAVGVAGHHFRSAVVACQWMKEGHEVNYLKLYDYMKQRFASTISSEEAAAVRNYIMASVKDTNCTCPPEAAAFTNSAGAVAPVFVWNAFDKHKNFDELQHPALQFFGCTYFQGPAKQLELCGMHYDRFRALYGLPVVPCGLSVTTVANAGWFGNLVFPNTIADETNLCKESLLECDKYKQVTRTKTKPEQGKYYFPGNPSHTCIDRAVVAYNKDSCETCLVLYQDKINAAGFPEAVKSLNKAAQLFAKDYTQILCVACVIGASDKTRKQNDFAFPYLLVRAQEVEAFFTPTFAPAIQFLRKRHELSLEAAGSPSP